MRHTTDYWDLKDNAVTETCCTACGDVRSCIYTDDPYIDRIRGKSLLKADRGHWCKSCWIERRDHEPA